MLDSQFKTYIKGFITRFKDDLDSIDIHISQSDTNMIDKPFEEKFNFSRDFHELLVKDIAEIITDWSDPEIIYQEVFDFFIELFLEIKLVGEHNSKYAFDRLYKEFELALNYLKEKGKKYSKIEIPFKIPPKTIDHIIKKLIENTISEEWISIPNWMVIYNNLGMREENFLLLQSLRKMILLIEFYEFWNKNLKDLIGV